MFCNKHSSSPSPLLVFHGSFSMGTSMDRCVSLWFISFYFFLVPTTAIEPSNYIPGAPALLECMHNTTAEFSITYDAYFAILDLIQHRVKLKFKYGHTSRYTAYAMFQCRGDQNMDSCLQCVFRAFHRLRDDCPSSNGARIQLDECYLRYDNKSFFTPDFSYAIGYCNGRTTDSVALAVISSLVQNVTTQAPKTRLGGHFVAGYLFASATAEGEYAAAQCLGYLNESECSQCLSSVPYTTLCHSALGAQVHLTSCYYRFEPYNFLATPAPNLNFSAPNLPPTDLKAKAILGVAFGVGALIIVAALCMGLLWRYNIRTKGRQEKDVEESMGLLQARAKRFSLQELESATRNFHLDNKLGEGGYGPVYKGRLSNEDIAVKRSSSHSHQGMAEFLNEVDLITKVQHRNLIKLIGYCVTQRERILVYEYLPNKSLDVKLFGSEGTTLDWGVRYGVVLGVAQGLAYLHEESQSKPCIVHRDIKPSNILLDDQLSPIISDFGLARLVREDESSINTNYAGTRGYVAPEYASSGTLTVKADVYSFGVLTLEVINGNKNSSSNDLLRRARTLSQCQQLELVDPKLNGTFSEEQARRMINVAHSCTKKDRKLRPTMSGVVSRLLGSTTPLR